MWRSHLILKAMVIACSFALTGCGAGPTKDTAQDVPLSNILVEKEDWSQVVRSPAPVDFMAGATDGSVRLYQGRLLGVINADGKFRPDNMPDFGGYGLVYTGKALYSVKEKQVQVLIGEKTQTLQLKGLTDPVCIMLWPDEDRLVIGESDGAFLWAVHLEKDGSFGPGDRYYTLRTKAGVAGVKMRVSAMTMDAGNLLFACTPLGIQVFDRTGRFSGIITAPSKDTMTAITIGGEEADTLFVACGDIVFARRFQGKASYTLRNVAKN
jgi:sugar lactone lactonase YvrE